MNEEILRLKREFREKWSFEKVAEIKQILKIERDMEIMEYLCDEVILECEIAKLARGYSANMVPGALLGSGCKKAYPWGLRVYEDTGKDCEMIKKVDVPTYPGLDKEGPEVTVSEFAGKMVLKFDKIEMRVYFEDIRRAWEAVKK